MGDKTSIEWSDATLNPVTGCTKVSAGCDNCYAETFAERWRGTPGHYYENGFDVQLRPDKLELPLRWKRPRRIFVNSMSDLFHDQVPDDYIARVWGVMAWSPHHTYQILTKRHARMRSLLNSRAFKSAVDDAWYDLGRRLKLSRPDGPAHPYDRWPLPNCWLGVSAENQQWADIRIPALLDTPAAVRFVSAEPLLGPIELEQWLHDSNCLAPQLGDIEDHCICSEPREAHINWVITGGESGPGARPAHPDWFRSIRDQCQAAGVAYLHKQNGEFRRWRPTDPPGRLLYVHRETGATTRDPYDSDQLSGLWTAMFRVGKHRAGRELDGRTWDQYPQAVTHG
ncbi:DUF5131 family protein [Mycobacterium sp. 23]|uniref:DUF5131 family protein n=1 Tax=Mycobacterium sp. 23 TaxID=3400424 RepID=UPI003AAD74E4